MKEKIIEQLTAQGHPMSTQALGEKLGENVELAAKELLEEGRLVLTKRHKLALPEQAGLHYGKISGNAKGFAFFIPALPGKDHYLSPENQKGAMDGDWVWVRELPQGGAEVYSVVQRARKTLVGTYKEKDGVGFVQPDEKKISYSLFIEEKDRGGAKIGDKVVVEILRYPSDQEEMQGQITEVLGEQGEKGVDMLSIIRRLELPDKFPEAALKEAKSLSEPDQEEVQGREDWRKEQVITIDGADAKDLDDAVSVQRRGDGYLLGVHIADVSHYVRPGSALDKEAYRRGTSVYFPDRVLPMLPHELSDELCSLNPNEDKLTLSCIMEIDARGNVTDSRVVKTIIRTRHRMTYDDVNEILAGNKMLRGEYSDIVQMLGDMRALADILHQNRAKRGGIDFELSEAEITLDASGRAVAVEAKERGISERIIEEFMLLANETVARRAAGAALPFLYRVHEAPSADKLETLKDFLGTMGYGIRNLRSIRPMAIQQVLKRAAGTKEEAVISRVTLRSMMKARYDPECLGHFGLALEYYCHFTSPIRRYPDLVVHRMLKTLLEGKKDKRRSNMAEQAKHCSDREVAATEAERLADDIKKCEYMSAHLGEEETGIVSGVSQTGFFVELPNTIEGMVRIASIEDDFYISDEKNYRVVGRRTGRTFRLGDEVWVKAVTADIETGKIEFLLFSGGEKRQEKHAGRKTVQGRKRKLDKRRRK